MVKLLRLILIITIGIGLLWVGNRFHVTVQDSKADVFDFFYGGTKSIPDFMEGANYSPKGKTIANGVPFTYSVEVVNASIDDVIDYYKNLYNPHFLRMFTDEQLERAGVQQGDDAFKAIRFYETIFAKLAPPVLEFKGETMGMLGILDMGDNTKLFIDKKAGEKIVPKVVMAFKENPESEKTVVVKYWTDKVFSFKNFVPEGNEDLPGFDLDDVDRHPYSQRLLSIAQKDNYASSKLVAYRVDDNIDSVIIYYLSDLRGNEWEIPETVVKALDKAKEKRFIYARKGNKSLYITFCVDRLNYTSVVMVEKYE
ncbi:hypothetical protein TTHT_0757 [Thermotomaculum hydrothermale]|uniref:Uncharacterized protein n=1 Tax=Thermotomaculum hydrothermale TaxID=981385 RepID=A0A7R6SZ07_9BACT|nr:hypothetical protein [Thermotomaculum hydrothermale]BBB32325.1 hypothetical protein TTHT_0757 [Thermotomaculum hydrothermale]